MKTFLLALLLAAVPVMDFNSAVLALSGALSLEELDESELERWQRLSEHPVDINSAPRSRLLSCGLFSAFEAASILDYRTRAGDILSLGELAQVDGIGEETAAALSHFIVLRTTRAPGQKPRERLGGSLMLRASLKDASAGLRFPFGIKAEATVGGVADLFWASRTTYSAPEFTAGTAHIAISPRGLPCRFILGDYSARFGQGLAMWSGFSMSGFSSVQAFRRSGTGLGASTSFSRSLHGAAAEFETGLWQLSAAYSYPGTGLLNATRWGRKSTLGATAAADFSAGTLALSADWRAASPSLALFGEAGVWLSPDSQPAPAALAGAVWVPSYGRKVSAVLRWYSKDYNAPSCGAARAFSKARDEAGAAVGALLPWLSATADFAFRPAEGTSQQKAVVKASRSFSAGPVAVAPSLLLSVRSRPQDALPFRTEVRGDISLTCGRLSLEGRADALWCRDFAWLWRAGPSWKGRSLQAGALFTLFKIDSWDDRIYAYERDAPGNFSIPAYYGRGWSLTALAGWKGMLYARVSIVEYPWTQPSKEGTAEAKLQCRLRF